MTHSLPQGFKTAGVHCGVKADPSVLDLSLFVSDRPASAGGVFTQNRVCGAPVKVSRQRLPRGSARAIVINSGNSNACTGDQGIDDAKWMTAEVAKLLSCPAEDVLVCSTGVIGRFLPKAALATGFPKVVAALDSTPEAYLLAARGIMTTDTVTKQSTREISLQGKTVRVTGVAKGAAMIAPNMATMLCVIMTDAVLSPVECDAMMRYAANRSFNCVSVEGHTSTSDSAILIANGASGAAATDDVAKSALRTAICEVATELAQAIIRDAEGATHFITVEIQGARTRDEAFKMAKSIADSPLVKTAIHGADPNWGRIISAAGYCGVDLKEEDMSLWVNNVLIYKDGAPTAIDCKAMSASIRDHRDCHIHLVLKNHGDAQIQYWTSDLTAEYVRLNADYTT